MQSPTYSPIAIIGMGCRFPGGADSPEKFWDLLTSGKDAVGDVPTDRWNQDYFYAADRTQPGAMIAPQGGFLHDVKGFDHGFFGLSSLEAANMDPQQRLALQVAWEAMEQGGVDAHAWAGRQVGVFMGCFTMDYHLMQFLDPLEYSAFASTGIMNTMLSNRLSYTFDFRGPSMSIDTACSASLTAVHQACSSLQRGESDLSLAGGAMLTLLPDFYIAETKTGFLSKDGRCKSFSAGANGYVRSEGVGVVVLKRLQDAIDAGDDIQGVIIGSAVNQDGHTTGITVPNGQAQMAVMRAACKQANINPAQVSFVEAHGTGTSSGDPIEARSIGMVYRVEADCTAPLWIGSCKSNIGHTESAAGIAGLIKTVLCLQKGQLPPNLHADPPNPAIPFDQLRLQIPRQVQVLARNETPWIAGVNAFGFGGSNAHVLVQAVPVKSDVAAAKREDDALFLFPVSAQSTTALKSLAAGYAHTIGQQPDARLEDWCYTAARRRSHLNHRKVFAVRSRQELCVQLQAFAEAPPVAVSRKIQGRKMVWVFSGVGALNYGMSRDLLAEQPVFREKYLQCTAMYQQISGLSVLVELAGRKKNDLITESYLSHPAQFFHQVSLAALWRSRGIQPEAVVGHSAGEFAAFYEAGVYSLEQCLALIFKRTEILRVRADNGAMLAVTASEPQITALLKAHNGYISVAACNGAQYTTLSGDAAALKKLAAEMKALDMHSLFLSEKVAYHHRPAFEALTAQDLLIPDLVAQTGQTLLYSTVLGGVLKAEDITADYWLKNLTEPVQFQAVIEKINKSGSHYFLEISGKPTLLLPLRAMVTPGKSAIVNAVASGPDHDLLTLANLYEAGFNIQWQTLYEQGRFLPLPTYAWQNEPLWQEPEKSRLRRLRPSDGVFLGAKTEGQDRQWEALLSTEKIPWLNEHIIMGEHLLPGATYIDMMLAALHTVHPDSAYILENLRFNKAVRFSKKAAFFTRLQLDVQHSQIAISSTKTLFPKQFEPVSDAAYRITAPGHSGRIALETLLEQASSRISGADMYAFLDLSKYQYGPAFQGIQQVYRVDQSVISELVVPAEYCDARYHLHPIVLDLVFQTALAIKFQDKSTPTRFEIPVQIEQIRVFGPAQTRMFARAYLVEETAYSTKTDLYLYDASGTPIAAITGFCTRTIQAAALTPGPAQIARYLSTPAWETRVLEPIGFTNKPQSFVLLSDKKGWATLLGEKLRLLGHEVVQFQFNTEPAASVAIRTGELIACLQYVDRQAIIINFLALDASTPEDIAPLVCEPVLCLAQAIRATQHAGKCWFITESAQFVAAHPLCVNICQAPLWGMARVFCHQEFAANGGGMVDITEATDLGLLAEIVTNSGQTEDQIALRNGESFVLRLQPFQQPLPVAPPAFSRHYQYLVTGGFGAIGKNVVEWMLQSQARHLILTTSRPVPSLETWPQHPDYAWILQLRQKGAIIEVIHLDLSDAQSVKSLPARIELDTVRGVIYCAGIVEDQILESLTETQLRRVLDAKITGAWALHELFKSVPLEHFVLFSSIGSCFPNRGQANYAAANAALDALAQQRRHLGLPGLSINWGAWSIGMVEKLGLEKVFASMGIGCLQAVQGIAALEAVFNVDVPQIVVQHMDWPLFLAGRNGQLPLFQYFQAVIVAKNLENELVADAGAMRLVVLQEVANMLNLPVKDVDTRHALSHYGLDSISMLILSDLIQKQTGVDVPVEYIGSAPSIDSVLEKIAFDMV